ncbi:MAG: peptidase M48 [Flavobacteriales bacterium CG_4_9_14_3_um_filter_40_17]|nr:MAG: peptidase M48 [Flavobacteriales bacterium CG_4_9_14_3_um_filter_40_17]
MLTYVFIAVIVINFLVDWVLDKLNASRFEAELPSELDGLYDANEYKKSINYKKVNYKFSSVVSLVSVLVTLGFLIFGGFEWADSLARTWSSNPVWMALLFFGIIGLGSELLNTPFSYYKIFVIEENFGFNKQTLKVFITDKLKSWALGVVLGGLILVAVLKIYEWFGIYFWWYAWILLTLFSIFMNLFYTKLIVPLFNKQAPLGAGLLKYKIEGYAQKVGFAVKNIFVIDGSKRSTKGNAYFSGFGKQKRITLYDTLIQNLNEDEIVAVLAHEVGHYKKKHIVYQLLISVLTSGLTLFLLSLFLSKPEFSLAIGVTTPSFHVGLVSFVILYSPISLVLGMIGNIVSRKFEFQADAYAKSTFEPKVLAEALKKLSKGSLNNLTPHPAYVFFNYSHPPVDQRIRKLKRIDI